jgi:spore coat polysaccharide biosynthesis protein SpsF
MVGDIDVYRSSILDFPAANQWDMVLVKGVLIHINPGCLASAYELLYRTSRKYVCIAEYYNPSPVEISYRGNSNVLFKRDFAGEFMDLYPDMSLLDYGFVYHRDPVHPQDDISWFLMEKAGPSGS